MIRGSFLSRPENTPVVPLTVKWRRAVLNPTFVLDTGFSGDFKMSPSAASDLGLLPVAVESNRIADGSFGYRASLDCKNRTVELERA